ncbi:Scarecrow-like protein 6, partial [Cucurbita argyrosperma subsp. argyrosperma]
MRGDFLSFSGKGDLEISAALSSSPICSGFAEKWVKKGEEHQELEEQQEGFSYFLLPNKRTHFRSSYEKAPVLPHRFPLSLLPLGGGGGGGGGCVPSLPPETPSVEPLAGAVVSPMDRPGMLKIPVWGVKIPFDLDGKCPVSGIVEQGSDSAAELSPIFNGSLENLVVPVSGLIQPFERPDEKPQTATASAEEAQFERSTRREPKRVDTDTDTEILMRNHQVQVLQQQQQQQQQLGYAPGLQCLPQQKAMSPKPKVVGLGDEMIYNSPPQQQQHALLDQLYKAAELVGTGNFSHAQGILARLNHQLSPIGKPLQRAAFYFKEALQLLLLMNNPVNPPPPHCPTPFDVIFKMGAYKVFSEISPLVQFVNFTCNQALLEALDDVGRIHIVDFDIGFGAQWASFMQELSLRNQGASLKITAFASPSTHHPIELGLMRENLTQFANDIGISFEFEMINFDSLNQNSFSLPFSQANENEAIAVNFPLCSTSNQPALLPSLLRFIKQLSPKLVVSLDRGCDRSDLPFPQHMLQALQSYINLLESLDAINMNSDAVNKIERFLLQPRIERTVLGRLRAPERMPLWKTLFASAGFTPVNFSNFTETQAECVAKRTSVRGFHVEKRQASLVLCWQRRELISASAWRC